MKPKVLSTEIVHRNPWYRVRHDRIEYPNGKPGEFFVAEFGHVALVVCEKDGRILLVQQYRYTIDRTTLEFPMGGLDVGETYVAGAKRELREETGMDADVVEIGISYSLNGACHNPVHIFVATNIREGTAEPETTEFDLTHRWVPVEEWRSMIRGGKITDGETLAAWTVYQEWKRR